MVWNLHVLRVIRKNISDNKFNKEIVMKKILLSSGFVVFLMVLSFAGHAAVVTWQLVSVTFEDGGVATGSFDYDADTDTFSAINIDTSGGTNPDFLNTPSYGIWGGDPFTTLPQAFVTIQSSWPDYPDETGIFVMGLILGSPLTNAGGTITVVYHPSSVEVICAGPTGCNEGNIAAIRRITGGSVSTVPIPAAAWLFGSGLIGLIGVARRKARA